jgi:CP family cyanate transporter-like MFS transporter
MRSGEGQGRTLRPSVGLTLAGILLTAMNLRPAFTSVGPALPDIRAELGLSGASAALLTGLPVLCLGLLAPLAPVLSRRLGLEGAMGAALVVLAAGLLLRALGGLGLLIAGTVVVGGAIAIANVLLPVIVKRDFPNHVGRVTGVYTSAMALTAAAAAAITIPVAATLGLGWRGGLGAWGVPVILAVVAWLPQLAARTPFVHAPLPGATRALLGDGLAWQVTLYLGLQSLGFYSAVAWVPSIYRDLGVDPVQAGLIVSIVPLAGVAGGLLIPAPAARRRDQRWSAFLVSIGTAVGLLGILVAPLAAPFVWVAIIGFAQGASFPLALTLIVLRTRNPAETQRLSAMAQTFGYVVAAAGPLAVGATHDLTRSWDGPLALLVGLITAQAVMGLGAGRARFVRVPSASESGAPG